MSIWSACRLCKVCSRHETFVRSCPCCEKLLSEVAAFDLPTLLDVTPYLLCVIHPNQNLDSKAWLARNSFFSLWLAVCLWWPVIYSHLPREKKKPYNPEEVSRPLKQSLEDLWPLPWKARRIAQIRIRKSTSDLGIRHKSGDTVGKQELQCGWSMWDGAGQRLEMKNQIIITRQREYFWNFKTPRKSSQHIFWGRQWLWSGLRRIKGHMLPREIVKGNLRMVIEKRA